MNQGFMNAIEVAEELGVSKAYAYKVIRELNEDLRNKGFQTVSGRINRLYFKEKFYLAGKEVKKVESFPPVDCFCLYLHNLPG